MSVKTIARPALCTLVVIILCAAAGAWKAHAMIQPPSFRYDGPIEARAHYIALASQQLQIHRAVMQLGPLPLSQLTRKVTLPDGTQLILDARFGRETVMIRVPAGGKPEPKKKDFPNIRGWFQVNTVPFRSDGDIEWDNGTSPWSPSSNYPGRAYLVNVTLDGGAPKLEITDKFKYIEVPNYLKTLEGLNELTGHHSPYSRHFTSCINEDMRLLLVGWAQYGHFHASGNQQCYFRYQYMRTHVKDEEYGPCPVGGRTWMLHRLWEEVPRDHSWSGSGQAFIGRIHRFELGADPAGVPCLYIVYVSWYQDALYPTEEYVGAQKFRLYTPAISGTAYYQLYQVQPADADYYEPYPAPLPYWYDPEQPDPRVYFYHNFETDEFSHHEPARYLDFNTMGFKDRKIGTELNINGVYTGTFQLSQLTSRFPDAPANAVTHEKALTWLETVVDGLPYYYLGLTGKIKFHTVLNQDTRYELSVITYEGINHEYESLDFFQRPYIAMTSSCLVGKGEEKAAVNVIRFRNGSWKLLAVVPDHGVFDLTEQFETEFARVFPETPWVPRNVAYAVTFNADIEETEEAE
ncbi:MAG TPA: hypothetical protein PK250_12730 [Syntrophobacter fumaroxidans]|nr:hypothetical protein [Syntrophobacter fumaroxidans]